MIVYSHFIYIIYVKKKVLYYSMYLDMKGPICGMRKREPLIQSHNAVITQINDNWESEKPHNYWVSIV